MALQKVVTSSQVDLHGGRMVALFPEYETSL